MKKLYTMLLPFCLLMMMSMESGLAQNTQDYLFSFPSNLSVGSSSSYIRLYISSEVDTRVWISTAGRSADTLRIVRGEITTYDLPTSVAQVEIVGQNDAIPANQLHAGRAIRLTAESPIALYGMNRTQYTSDGMQIAPISELGTEYVAASYSTNFAPTVTAPTQILVVGTEDDTQVSIVPSDSTGGVSAGETIQVTLNEGDVYSLFDHNQGDLTGTIVAADKKIAVFEGSVCTQIPKGVPACDHIVEMSLPVDRWTDTVHALPLARREKGEIYRILARDTNTVVSINGVIVDTLPESTAPGSRAMIEYAPGAGVWGKPILFTATKPIRVVQYNPSQQYDGVQTDPFMLNLFGKGAGSTDLVSSTPESDFPANFVALVTESAYLDSIEVRRVGQSTWEPAVERLDVRKMVFAADSAMGGLVASISPGSYQFRARVPFHGYLYGSSSYDSYGYPLTAAWSEVSVTAGSIPAMDPSRPGQEWVIELDDLFRNESLVKEAVIESIEIEQDPHGVFSLVTSVPIQLEPESAADLWILARVPPNVDVTEATAVIAYQVEGYRYRIDLRLSIELPRRTRVEWTPHHMGTQ